MTKPRYSIIPAGAVTDPNLEGNDLRVLCFLGQHTDKLGWCFLSQGKIADALGIGRATVQRSLARLTDAGWISVKSSTVSGRPHACHAYRVIMDRDDPEIGPSELEVEDQEQDGRCPQAGTSGAHAERARVPGNGGQGVPTHTRAQKDQDSEPDVDVSARARAAPMISEQAHQLAEQIATIAGHDPAFLPTTWISDGPAMRVQMMLNRGWRPEMMTSMAKAMMDRKRDGPPRSIGYFEPGFESAHRRQSQPAPLPTSAATPATISEDRHGQNQPSDWRARRDQQHSAFAEFKQANAEARERASEDGGGAVVQLVPNARRA